MGFISWIFYLAVGAVTGAIAGAFIFPEDSSAGSILGATVGLLLSYIIQASRIEGPKYPGHKPPY